MLEENIIGKIKRQPAVWNQSLCNGAPYKWVVDSRHKIVYHVEGLLYLYLNLFDL